MTTAGGVLLRPENRVVSPELLGGVHEPGGVAAGLTHGLGQRGEVFIVFVEVVYVHQLPAQRCCDPGGMVLAQVPAMRIVVRQQRPNDGSRLRVGIGQRGNGWLAATGSGATAKLIHALKV